jgi:hypothetical protein
VLYFAYGSNLDWDQMRSRCPSAQFVAVVTLPDHRLVFPRFSVGRRCDVASIAAAEREVVWGVVYEIDGSDRNALDACEGFHPHRDPARNAYEPTQIEVVNRGRPAEPLEVFTYVARPQRGFTPRGPDQAYLGLILRGARHWGLPEAYCRFLASHAAQRSRCSG